MILIREPTEVPLESSVDNGNQSPSRASPPWPNMNLCSLICVLILSISFIATGSENPVPFGWSEFENTQGHYVLIRYLDMNDLEFLNENSENIIHLDASTVICNATNTDLTSIYNQGLSFQKLTWFEFMQLFSSSKDLGRVYELGREHQPFVLAGESVDFHITLKNNTTETNNYTFYLWYNSPSGLEYIGSVSENDVTGGSSFTIDYTTVQPSADYPKSYTYSIYEDGNYEYGSTLYVNNYNQPQSSFEVAIFCTESLYPIVLSRLATYSDILSDDYSCNVSIHHDDYTTAALRDSIVALWNGNPSVDIVILVGSIPFPSWEFPWGEHCPLISYYSELDGSFSDTNSDGYYDYHDWGTAENGPDIGLFMMRPPDGYENYTSSFLDRVIDYHNNAGQTLPEKGLICRNHDWWSSITDLQPAFETLFGEPEVDYLGGWDSSVSGQSWLNTLGAGYLLADIWVHSAPNFHQFDTAPHQNVWTNDIAALTEGVRFMSLSGCHACDFIEQPVNCFATNGYLNHNKGLALIGPVRSIGITCSPCIFNALAYGKTIGEAIEEHFSYIYTREYVDTYTTDNPENFIWEYGMFGDPFITFTEDTLSIESDVEAAIADEIAISAAQPNPITVSARLNFSLPESSLSELSVYDIIGRKIEVLHKGVLPSGLHALTWVPDTDLKNGIYFIRLSTNAGAVSIQVLVIR